jgi:hypothetical protein
VWYMQLPLYSGGIRSVTCVWNGIRCDILNAVRAEVSRS